MPTSGGNVTAEAARTPSPPDLGAADRLLLLGVARSALAVATESQPPAALRHSLAAATGQRVGGLCGAVFVTLSELGELRGCMGTRDASLPLPDAVADASLTTALCDPRFWPVRADELAAIHVDISILGPFVELPGPDFVQVGVDGVVVARDGHRGLLLPEVAVTQRWDAPILVNAACQKAGLPGDAWRDPGTRLFAFRTLRFGGPASEPP